MPKNCNSYATTNCNKVFMLVCRARLKTFHAAISVRCSCCFQSVPPNKKILYLLFVKFAASYLFLYLFTVFHVV